MTEYDLLFIIPLEEEFQVFRKYFNPRESNSLLPPFYYPTSISNLDIKTAAGIIGKMGTAPTAAMAAQAISDLHPKIVILLGIAGALDNNLRPGDIVIASQIFEYEALGKTVPAGDKYIYQRSGYTFRPDATLRELSDHFRNNDSTYLDWQQAVNDQASEEGISPKREVPNTQAKEDLSLIQFPWPELNVGFIASGNTVSASGVYKVELTERDRKLIALEMEAAGVAHAIENSPYAPRLLVVRGISDWGDEQKTKLDNDGKGAWRRLAMFSVCAFLDRFLRLPSITSLINSSQPAIQQPDIDSTSLAITQESNSFTLELSLDDRIELGNMIVKSATVDTELMRVTFCKGIGINESSLYLTQLPPAQFGLGLVNYIIDNQKIKSWERLGDKLREHAEGKQRNLLNRIFTQAKQPDHIQPPPPSGSKIILTTSELIALERIPDLSLRKIEKRLRDMNWTPSKPTAQTQADVNLLAVWYFSAQLAEVIELSEQINLLIEELEHDPKGKQLTVKPREIFRKLLRICQTTQTLLQQESKGETLAARHVFGQNTLNCLRDVKAYTDKTLIALNENSGNFDSDGFHEALIGIDNTLPRMIDKFKEANAYIHKTLKV